MVARLSGLLGADRRLKIDLTPTNPQFDYETAFVTKKVDPLMNAAFGKTGKFT